jgi:alanyl-tRNA synthetase
LRDRLGDHVTQKGSLVDADRLRFDISHPKALTAEEISDVETVVNAAVRANADVSTRLMDPESAIEAGAMALFGEKYGDEVRVVSMGGHSIELCGGTHVRRTGDIGFVKVVAEGAVGSGVRRIEAVTGAGALAYASQRDALLTQTADLLKTTPTDLPSRVSALQDKKLALAGDGATSNGPASKMVNGVTFSGRVLEGVPAKELKGMADEIKKQIGSGVVALIALDDGKASLVVGVTDDLKDTHSAVDLVRAGSAAVGGKGGGGRPDMAQAGGPDGSKAADALAAIEAVLAGA